MDNSSLMKNDNNDFDKVKSNVNDVEITAMTVVQRKNNIFEKIVSKVFPTEIDKVNKKIIRDSLQSMGTKKLQQYDLQAQYEIKVLEAILNARLKDGGIDLEGIISKKLGIAYQELAEFFLATGANFEKTVEPERERINKTTDPLLKKRSNKSLDNIINTMFDVIDDRLVKFKKLLDDTIKVKV